MFDGMGQEVDILTTYAVAFALLALLINLLAWQLPRVRRFEKRLVVDGVVIAGFCLVVSMWSQPILRFILAQVTK